MRHVRAVPRSDHARVLRQCLLGLAFLGVIAMLSLPAARGADTAVGWLPLWLLGMPLAALAALWLRDLRPRFPDRRLPAPAPAGMRRRPGPVQARRRPRSGARVRVPAAA